LRWSTPDSLLATGSAPRRRPTHGYVATQAPAVSGRDARSWTNPSRRAARAQRHRDDALSPWES
jgi:hypothetical protein